MLQSVTINVCLCRLKLLAVELHLGGVYHQCGGDHHLYILYFPCLLDVIFSLIVDVCERKKFELELCIKNSETTLLWVVLNSHCI
jgi:hypothetical protein